jgi:hypothetical protein
MNAIETALQVVDVLNREAIDYMLVGSFSSNHWGIPRSTKDADFVLQLAPSEISRLWTVFEKDFELDSQLTFETKTGSQKIEMRHRGTAFLVELFLLSSDGHHQERFRRRQREALRERVVWYPTPEDVIIQKVRWARTKDLDDARDVIAVQFGKLDFPYVERWCREHGTLERLNEIRRSIPPI